MPDVEIAAKIKALLARAREGSGASEEERRTSAILAAEMMHRYGFTPQADAGPAAPQPQASPPRPAPAQDPPPSPRRTTGKPTGPRQIVPSTRKSPEQEYLEAQQRLEA